MRYEIIGALDEEIALVKEQMSISCMGAAFTPGASEKRRSCWCAAVWAR